MLAAVRYSRMADAADARWRFGTGQHAGNRDETCRGAVRNRHAETVTGTGCIAGNPLDYT